MTEAGRLIFGVICAVNQQIRKRLECLQILVKLMKIVQKSPDLVLSSTLNTYTTDLINFQSAQMKNSIGTNRRDGVNDIKQLSNPSNVLLHPKQERLRKGRLSG